MLTRRLFLASASAFALAGPVAVRGQAGAPRIRAHPVPLETVRLRPSLFLRAVETNRRFLLSLEPNRLLHNFQAGAGIEPPAPAYGGWEGRGIAGHTLGHYLSACSLMHAQTGDREVRGRVEAIVAELAHCQARHGDGYVGGTTVERDGRTVDGKIVFEEIRRGEIRAGPFDVNGGWVPLYAWHKVHAGLIDAVRSARVEAAMPVMLAMADYLATILEGLDEAQMQRLLVAEHGGLNESYAETYALTGDARWLRLAGRIRDRRVLDPLTDQRDILPGLHANTQIPKLIGLARLYELTGDERHKVAARFFADTVAARHSYVIGGNSEREHFGPPASLSQRITDRTCEHCNSYNMLKLVRHLYGWEPDAALFDFYERVHFNHILAAQEPETGRFAYFMPLGPGARRIWTGEDSLWCCVGSGMESHAKHGDSIYWHEDETLFVNLFIPSSAGWDGLNLDLDTGFPLDELVRLTVTGAPPEERAIALRLPGWCAAPTVRLNDAPVQFERGAGYAVLRRAFQPGDRIELNLPMALRAEPTPDDPTVTAWLHGPLVLAADLGPASAPFETLPPTRVGAAPPPPEPLGPGPLYRLDARPAAVTLHPFAGLTDRRTAVYFPTVGEARWSAMHAAFAAEGAARARLDARTADRILLGEPESEAAHAFASNQSDLLSWCGRSGRQAWWGEGHFLEFDLAVRPGRMAVRALYWGEEIDKNFTIHVDGAPVATERRPGPAAARWVETEYPLSQESTRGKARIRVRIETRGSDAPVYEVRTVQIPRAGANLGYTPLALPLDGGGLGGGGA
jgi:DUF1680 family protein